MLRIIVEGGIRLIHKITYPYMLWKQELVMIDTVRIAPMD